MNARVTAERSRSRVLLAQGALVLVLWWCGLGRAHAQLAVDRLPPETNLATVVQLLEDPRGTLGLADVRSPEAEFVPHRRSEVSLGFSRSVLWLRFGVHNVSPRPMHWWLEFGEPSLDHVQVFVVHGDGSLELHEGGDARPFSTRVVPHARTVFELTAPAHDQATFYVRVQSEDVMRVPLHAYTPSAYAQHHERLTALEWLLYGVLLMMAAYNAAVFAMVRRVEYIRYACVSLALCLV
ncbi:MAG TPA: 7TM-DISM domain-containing protein, partial [Polyangiales bacterium]